MMLTEILERAGRRRKRRRVGRGSGSGSGKTAGRGHKGAKARSGWKRRLVYEGGQMPLVRRLPKRGFSNARFRKRYDVVNVALLERVFEPGAQVDLRALEERGILKPRHGRLKVLGEGDLTKSLTVVADDISEVALRKIEVAGGTARRLGERKKKRRRQ